MSTPPFLSRSASCSFVRWLSLVMRSIVLSTSVGETVMFLRRAEGEVWPDVSDEVLAADPSWLAPFVVGKTKLDEIGADHPEHSGFVSEMRTLVDRFDLDRYMATLMTLQSHDH